MQLIPSIIPFRPQPGNVHKHTPYHIRKRSNGQRGILHLTIQKRQIQYVHHIAPIEQPLRPYLPLGQVRQHLRIRILRIRPRSIHDLVRPPAPHVHRPYRPHGRLRQNLRPEVERFRKGRRDDAALVVRTREQSVAPRYFVLGERLASRAAAPRRIPGLGEGVHPRLGSDVPPALLDELVGGFAGGGVDVLVDEEADFVSHLGDHLVVDPH
mmetsp:Transcript_39006/g.81641  ORF Transcript_39006/g.81641 Transcript_39006/m.81641 type:complete len:211 (+) Transcript_39006:713-1345(+)